MVEDIDVLCLYGFGQGLLYEELQPWLEGDADRAVLFLIEEGETLPWGHRVFFDSKVRICSPAEGIDHCFAQYVWEFVFLRFGYVMNPEVAHKKTENILQKFRKIEWHIQLLASDAQDLTSAAMKNTALNIQFLKSHYDFSYRKDALKGVPAIICGAGPSLEKSFSLLKSLKDRAAIFAGGAALSILSLEGITCHVAAGLDPDPSLGRFKDFHGFETPFFYQDRFSFDIASRVHAEKIFVPDHGSNRLRNWLLDKVSIASTPFDAGWTVTNMATAIAHHLGCDPIIFVGVDFSFRSSSPYAKGMAEQEVESTLALPGKDGLFSKKDWLLAASWTEDFIAKHTERTFLNVSEEKQTCFSCPSISSEELQERYLRRYFDLQGVIHSMQKLPAGDHREKSVSLWLQLEESVKRCDALCSSLLALIEKYYPSDATQKGDFLLAELDLQEELAYHLIIEPLWGVWQRVFNRKKEVPIYFGALNRFLFYKKMIHIQLKEFFL